MAQKYDTYQVCENGHGINDRYTTNEKFNKAFCTECGKKTLTECPNCKENIKGGSIIKNRVFAGIKGNTTVPNICEHCGEDFPWRTKKEKIASSNPNENRNDIFLIEKLLSKFHLVAKQLKERHSDRETLNVNDEYDVQDLLHALLKIYFDDIRPEEWNPSYAGSSTRSDFLLKNEDIVIEVKKTRTGLKDKQIGEQLIIDIAKYRTHPNCKLLYCFVYDPDGHIENPNAIENDLNDEVSEMKVKVKILPKGH